MLCLAPISAMADDCCQATDACLFRIHPVLGDQTCGLSTSAQAIFVAALHHIMRCCNKAATQQQIGSVTQTAETAMRMMFGQPYLEQVNIVMCQRPEQNEGKQRGACEHLINPD